MSHRPPLVASVFVHADRPKPEARVQSKPAPSWYIAGSGEGVRLCSKDCIYIQSLPTQQVLPCSTFRAGHRQLLPAAVFYPPPPFKKNNQKTLFTDGWSPVSLSRKDMCALSRLLCGDLRESFCVSPQCIPERDTSTLFPPPPTPQHTH